MLREMRLSSRILLLGISIIVGFSLTYAWIIPRIQKIMYEAKYTKTKHVVESAWGVLDYYAKQAKAKAMPVEEAKKRAIATIKNVRYDQEDYFWINDLEPRMVMHPVKTEMDGKNLSEEADPNGKRLFAAMVEITRINGAGFVDYLWARPDSTKPVPKISYVKLLPEWGWIVGSGIYLDDVKTEVWNLLYAILGIVAAIVVGGLGLCYFMTRSIARPIQGVIEDLTGGADQLASASARVSSASQSLAEGISEQAAGIEETSSSIEEMASMTRQNADNAQQANTLMLDTGKVVDEANHSMKSLTQSMNEISMASEETAKIIKTIDEIAFQTNLLALNAAVEAARAGEAGAGFAVVADEVRNLAMRAAEAAKNTANLIEGTVKKIRIGSEIVSKSNEAFTRVAAGAKKAGELVDGITGASGEQAQGIDQISKAVGEMDKIIQKNAAHAEEAAAAAQAMNARADLIKEFSGKLALLVGGSGKINPASLVEIPNLASRQVSPAKSAPGNGGQRPPAPLARKSNSGKGPYPRAREARPDRTTPFVERGFKKF